MEADFSFLGRCNKPMYNTFTITRKVEKSTDNHYCGFGICSKKQTDVNQDGNTFYEIPYHILWHGTGTHNDSGKWSSVNGLIPSYNNPHNGKSQNVFHKVCKFVGTGLPQLNQSTIVGLVFY